MPQESLSFLEVKIPDALLLVLFKKVHYLLQSVSIIRIDDNLVEITVDTAHPEYILDGVPYPFEDVVLSVQMYRDEDVWSSFFGVWICRDYELMTWITTLANK